MPLSAVTGVDALTGVRLPGAKWVELEETGVSFSHQGSLDSGLGPDPRLISQWPDSSMVGYMGVAIFSLATFEEGPSWEPWVNERSYL